MLLACCALELASSIASAGQLICKSHALTKSDEARAEAAMKREVGALEINSKETSYCRNLTNAHAWFVTTRVQATDGAFDHVTASCSRGWAHWSCEIYKLRTINFRFDAGSKPGIVTIPADMPPQFADDLFRRADNIARKEVTAERSCSRRTTEADDYALRIRDAYISADNIDGAEISNEVERVWDGSNHVATGRQLVMVTRGLMYLQFVRANGAEDLRFDCWDVWLVVG